MPHHNDQDPAHADVVRRVRTLAAKLEHPAMQVLTAEQYRRVELEVRTLFWITRDRVGHAWRATHDHVLRMIKRVHLLDPTRDLEIHIPMQITPVWVRS